MSNPPPKKKLCQPSILSMLSKKGSKTDCKNSNESNAQNCIEETSKKSSQHPDIKPKVKSSMDSSRAERCSLTAIAAERRMTTAGSGDSCTDSSPETSSLSWSMTPLDSLPSLSKNNVNMPPVIPAPDHTILVKLPLSPEQNEIRPFPATYKDIWDERHVYMPNSPHSLYPSTEGGESPTLIPRWTLICDALTKPIKTADELEAAILSYNRRYKNIWKFHGLKSLIQHEMGEEEQDYFFDTILPGIIKLALSLPSVVTSPPPLFQKQTNMSLTMSQHQVACLLANAFLCTFPRRNTRGYKLEYCSYPEINFNRLFFYKKPQALEKMKCIMHYFKEMILRGRNGLITFSRQNIPLEDIPRFKESSKPLPKLHLDSNGCIEEATGLLQVDFANKYLGGGVLGLGCVQEEIRFVLCPELLVTLLFVEQLNKRDSLVITGAEQFSRGDGYSSSFSWVCPYNDETPRDAFRRKFCQVVAIDAIHFRAAQTTIQYEPKFIQRELIKAYAGFRVLDGSPGTPVAVATGNWGCGAFNGDPRFKALIQIAASGEAGRDVAYFTFGDVDLRDQLSHLYQYLCDKGITIGELISLLYQFGSSGRSSKDLYHYIRQMVSADHSDTDSGHSENWKTFDGGECSSKKAHSDDFQNSKTSSCSYDSKRVTEDMKRLNSQESSSNKILKEEEFQDYLDQCADEPTSYWVTTAAPQKETAAKNSLEDTSETSKGLFECLDEIDKNLK